MERLLAELGHPESNLRCLHVAGTNGKGSVCAFAESILLASGHRTGLYTSPHLVDFSERIRIAGKPVADSELEEGILRLRQSNETIFPESDTDQPTFFELTTALALDFFARAGCDVVILETGLGGRLDATNLAPKVACAITPIALDHTEWLGETLGEIAREKAGILRSGVRVAISPQEREAAETLAAVALEMGAPVEWVTEPVSASFQLGLSGSHQRQNAALALALIRAGGFDPSPESVERGLADVVWPGRFQRIKGGRLILDGAHNIHAAQQLVATWREEFGSERCRLIFGALNDKDPHQLLSLLESISSEVLLVPVSSPRSSDPGFLAKQTSEKGVPRRVFGSLKEALAVVAGGELDGRHAPQAPVLVTGSLYLVGEALAMEAGCRLAPLSQ
jgi:dihydrofolate synthase/folylpolyglutamate synthase